MKKSSVLAGVLAILVLVVLAPLSSLSKTTSENADTVVLTSANLLTLTSEVSGESVGVLISRATELDSKNKSGKPLYLYLNTPGGSIQSGLELIEALKGLGRPINTITSFAASMGFQIAQNLDTRYIIKNGILMSHRAAGQMQGSFGGPSPSQMESRYHLWLQRTIELDETTVSRTNGKQTLESYQNAYANELWLTGTQAVAGGYADRVIKVKCDSTLSGVSQHSVEYLGAQISYDLSDCPINTSPINIRIGQITGPMTSEYLDHIKGEFLTSYMGKMNDHQVVDSF